MLAQVHSFVLQGIEPAGCEVEVDVADSGLPKTTVCAEIATLFFVLMSKSY